MNQSLIEVKPASKVYALDTTAIQNILTHLICMITEKTTVELGILGHTAYYDLKTKKKDILSKFKLSTIGEYTKAFGANDEVSFPDLERLADILYIKDWGLEVFDLDEKKDEIIFRWHSNLSVAAMCNISLDSPILAFDYVPVVKPSKKDVKKKEIRQTVPMVVKLEVGYNYNEAYDPNAVPSFLERFNL